MSRRGLSKDLEVRRASVWNKNPPERGSDQHNGGSMAGFSANRKEASVAGGNQEREGKQDGCVCVEVGWLDK